MTLIMFSIFDGSGLLFNIFFYLVILSEEGECVPLTWKEGVRDHI